MQRVRLALIVGALAALWALQPCAAWACSCAADATPQLEHERATHVFVGKLVDITNGAPLPPGDASVRASFAVTEVWKGPSVERITVASDGPNTSCAMVPWRKNETYLVYANAASGTIFTNICARTRLIADAGDDLQFLGAGNHELSAGSIGPETALDTRTTPSPAPETTTPTNGVPSGVWIGVIVVLVVVIGLGAWQARRG